MILTGCPTGSSAEHFHCKTLCTHWGTWHDFLLGLHHIMFQFNNILVLMRYLISTVSHVTVDALMLVLFLIYHKMKKKKVKWHIVVHSIYLSYDLAASLRVLPEVKSTSVAVKQEPPRRVPSPARPPPDGQFTLLCHTHTHTHTSSPPLYCHLKF